MSCSNNILFGQVPSRLRVNIAIRISERLVIAIATNDHTYMVEKMQQEGHDDQLGSSQQQMQQY